MVTIGYEPNGDKTRVKTVKTGNPNSPTTIETNTYDNLSRIQTYTIGMFGKTPMSSLYVYDTVNRLTSVTYPDALNTSLAPKIVTPSYNNASRLEELKVNGATHLSEIAYNPMSQVTQLKTGAYTNNADIEQYFYDAQTGLLTNQQVFKQNTSQPLLNLSYNYQRGNSKGSLNGKTGQLTNIVNNLDSNKNRVYEFDTLGRLMTAKGGQAAGGNGVANWTQNYGYDRFGNRTSVTASGVTANNQAVPTDGLASLNYQNQSNQTLTNQITTAGYEYDSAGNMLRGQAPNGAFQRFQYDAAGRLVKVMDDSSNELESYSYGASRQRLRTTIPNSQTTYYAWGGSSVLVEYSETTGNSASFKFSKSYIYAGSRLLSTQMWDGTAETTEFHHPDRLGTKLVTNNAANTHYEQSTLPFGTSLDAEFIGTPTTNQRFTSYDRSNVASLDYAVNRSYASGQGRFTSVDPIGAGASSVSNPQSNNLYSYTQNNPIDFVDPSGLYWRYVYGCSLESETVYGENGDGSTTNYYWICYEGWVWVNEPSEPPSGGGGGLDDLVNDRLKTNSGQCESKLNALMKALGKGNDFRKFAQSIMNGTDKLKRKVSMNETNNLGEYDAQTRTLNLDPRNADNGFVFIHEALHAAGAGMFGGSFSHQEILRRMSKVDKFDFKSVEKEISSIVQEREKTTPFKDAKEKAEFVDMLYSNRMNWWLNNYCKAEGGSQQWQDFVKKHPK